MDPTLVKGHFFLGQSLLELECYDEAIKHLQRGILITLIAPLILKLVIYASIPLPPPCHYAACDLAKEQKRNFGDDIAFQLRNARKKRWNAQEERRIQQEIELQTYLNKLINADMEKRIADIKLDDAKNEDAITKEVADVEQQCTDYATELNNVFAKVDDRRRVSFTFPSFSRGKTKTTFNFPQNIIFIEFSFHNVSVSIECHQKREVPDYLCGKISFDILEDPVITPSGITYERKDIEEHLQRVGHFDPVTRVKLVKEDLIANFSMKEVIDAFMTDNEWAHEY